MMQSKVYDCFQFNGEWNVLNIRLHTHDPAVDYFVIAEGNHTQTGIKKTLKFDFEHPVVKPFVHKIRYIPVTDMPNTNNPWDNEFFLRNALSRGLWDAQDTDWVIISDCDEIIRTHVILQVKAQTQFSSVGFQQDLYYCYLNNKQVRPADPWIYCCAVQYALLRGAHMQSFRGANWQTQIANAGWHYSYMMNTQQIKEKLISIADTWVNNPRLIDTLDPEACAQHGVDLLGRPHIGFQLVDVAQADLPEFVSQNTHLFKDYMLEPDPHFNRPRPKYLEHYAENVPGWFTPLDMQFYSWLVKGASSPSHFVEVGSFKGRSGAHMAVEIINSGKHIQFDCVDHWLGSEEHQQGSQSEDVDVVQGTLWDQFERNMRPVKGNYRAVRMSSTQAAQHYVDHSLDMVFLDAGHDYDNVCADIQAWLPKVKPGGMLAGHDYPHPPVAQAVQELLVNVGQYGLCWFYFKP